ncbi:hypothetical protein JXM67_06110 [candidate division WOR-3 bacterium]|nr:hypothetical protein [candidate division WOR-3 bacterium]
MDFDIAPLDKVNRITLVILVIIILGILSVPLWFPYAFPVPYPLLVHKPQGLDIKGSRVILIRNNGDWIG